MFLGTELAKGVACKSLETTYLRQSWLTQNVGYKRTSYCGFGKKICPQKWNSKGGRIGREKREGRSHSRLNNIDLLPSEKIHGHKKQTCGIPSRAKSINVARVEDEEDHGSVFSVSVEIGSRLFCRVTFRRWNIICSTGHAIFMDSRVDLFQIAFHSARRPEQEKSISRVWGNRWQEKQASWKDLGRLWRIVAFSARPQLFAHFCRVFLPSPPAGLSVVSTERPPQKLETSTNNSGSDLSLLPPAKPLTTVPKRIKKTK